ncbi:MAG: hypothetical protein QMD13_10360, partial [Candidatus Bathyarchaeia archaeon]|nr:hypothetical protein [Candidatus Bathyarchaeia archaeon]
GEEAPANLLNTFCKATPKLTMMFSLRLSFQQNLPNHNLNFGNLTFFPFLHKPIIHFFGNANVEIRQTDNTNNYVKT